MVEGEGEGYERSGLHFSDIVLAVAVLSAQRVADYRVFGFCTFVCRAVLTSGIRLHGIHPSPFTRLPPLPRPPQAPLIGLIGIPPNDLKISSAP